MNRSIRYLTDEHVATAIARGLEKRGIDAITVAEADLLGSPDDKLLTFARGDERVIVTQDQDFLQIASREETHPGIVFVSQDRSLGETVRMLDLLVQVGNAEEMKGRVEFI